MNDVIMIYIIIILYNDSITIYLWMLNFRIKCENVIPKWIKSSKHESEGSDISLTILNQI